MAAWNDDGFDAAVERIMRQRGLPSTPPPRPAPVNPGPCSARCCKTPYGHAQQVTDCPCHPAGSIR